MRPPEATATADRTADVLHGDRLCSYARPVDDARTLTFDTRGDVLHVVGSVDEDIVPLLRERLAEFVASHRGRMVEVDVNAVDFLPSAGIGALVAAQGAAVRAGGLLTLVAAPGSLAARVFDLMGIEHDDGPGVRGP